MLTLLLKTRRKRKRRGAKNEIHFCSKAEAFVSSGFFFFLASFLLSLFLEMEREKRPLLLLPEIRKGLGRRRS